LSGCSCRFPTAGDVSTIHLAVALASQNKEVVFDHWNQFEMSFVTVPTGEGVSAAEEIEKQFRSVRTSMPKLLRISLPRDYNISPCKEVLDSMKRNLDFVLPYGIGAEKLG
jgi:hypothetical protein